jgi:hypothetical protein
VREQRAGGPWVQRMLHVWLAAGMFGLPDTVRAALSQPWLPILNGWRNDWRA